MLLSATPSDLKMAMDQAAILSIYSIVRGHTIEDDDYVDNLADSLSL